MSKCILCGRKGFKTTYYFLKEAKKTSKEKIIILCSSHKAVYMAHGIKRLTTLMGDVWH